MKFIAIALSVALSLSASALAQSDTDTSDPAVTAVIGNQIKAFRSGSHDEAFSYASPNLRKMFGSTERFIGMVKSGYGAIYGAQNWTFGRSRTISGTLYQEVTVIGPKGQAWVALYSMQKQEDGSWKITGVQMKKAEGNLT